MKRLVSTIIFLFFIFNIAKAQITLQPASATFVVYTIQLFLVDDYTGNKQYIGLFGDKTRIDVFWNAKYYPESLDPINVTCWLNCKNNTDITQCYGLQNCSYQGKTGAAACTIFNPNYNYSSINNITCKFFNPNYPSIDYRTSEGTYPQRVFYPIKYFVSVSGGIYQVGRTINLPITFVSYSFLNSNYTGLVSTQPPTIPTCRSIGGQCVDSFTCFRIGGTCRIGDFSDCPSPLCCCTPGATPIRPTTTTSTTTTPILPPPIITTTTTLPRPSPIPSPPIITSSFSLFPIALAQASFISIDNSYNTTNILKYSQIGTVYPKITVIYAGGKTTLYIYTTANELPSCYSANNCPDIATQGYQLKACIQNKCQYIFTIEIGSAYLSLPEYGIKELIIILFGALVIFFAILKLKNR